MGTHRHDTVVIGGGQAGLAVGYHLARRGTDFVVVDAGPRVGAAWRHRWDSLRLFTPARFNHLPGMPFPAPDGYFPTKDEMADYLEAYAARFRLPVELGVTVDELGRHGDHYLITAGHRSLEAHHVVVATGTATTPRVPAFAEQLDPAIVQLHSADYRNPGQLRDGAVLVVGAGNSGAEIALELAPTHRTWLAGRDTGRIPITLGGPIFQAMNRLLTVDTRLGRRFAAQGAGRGTPLVRVRPQDLTDAGVQRAPRLIGVTGGRPKLDDGRVLEVDSVVWCTGFARDYRWIRLPVFGLGGDPVHHRGVVGTEPGLFFVGLPFQYSLASSLIGGVGPDALYLVEQIATREVFRRPPRTQARARQPWRGSAAAGS
jgi:putative flavoprotein involved in K+ transport